MTIFSSFSLSSTKQQPFFIRWGLAVGLLLGRKGTMLFCMLFMQTGLLNAQQFYFQNLSVEEGLPMSQANQIAQDAQGHLWIATLGGLSRFDGNTFTNYTKRNGLVSNFLLRVIPAKDGRVWVGSEMGVSCIDGQRVRNYTFLPNPTDNYIYSMAIDATNKVWVTVKGRLFVVDNQQVKKIPLPSDNPHPSAYSVMVDHRQCIWVSTVSQGIFFQKNNVWQHIPYPAEPCTGKLYADAQNRIWLLSTVGLYRLQGTTFQKVEATIPSNISDLLVVSPNEFWLAAEQGAYHIQGKQVQHFTSRNGFTDTQIIHIFKDSEGNIWFSSNGQGIFKYTGGSFTHYDKADGLTEPSVMSVTKGKQNNYWLATNGGGIFQFDGHRFRPFPLPTSNPAARQVMPILVDNQGNTWFGTNGDGLWRYRGKQFKRFGKSEGLPTEYNLALVEDAKKRIWVGTFRGVAYFDGERFRALQNQQGWLSGRTAVMAEIGVDSLVVGAGDGVWWVLQGQKIVPISTKKELQKESISCVKKLKNHWIAFGTDGQGLLLWNYLTDELLRFDTSHGLSSNLFYNLTTDAQGDLWAGVSNGLNRIQINWAKKSISVQIYGRSTGAMGSESNQNAVLNDADGSLWFGTIKGLIHYVPNVGKKTIHPPHMMLTGVKVFSKPMPQNPFWGSLSKWYNVPQPLELPYNQNHLTFEYVGISHTNPEKVQYQYTMEDIDKEWLPVTRSQSVIFPELPPGRFVFKVRSSCTEGVWSSEVRYPFTISPPFYQTWPFRILVLFGLMGLGSGIQLLRSRWQANRRRMIARIKMEEQAYIRKRTAEDFHDELGNKLTRITVLTDVLTAKFGVVEPDLLKLLTQIKENTQSLYSGTKDLLWAMNPLSDNLYEILLRVKDFGVELFQDTPVQFTFVGLTDEFRNFQLPMDYNRNMTMIFKEALNNILRHANCQQVKLVVSFENNKLLLKLTDDGVGFSSENYRKGHGLDNINTRAKRLNAQLELNSEVGKGTQLSLCIVVPEKLA